MEDNAASNDIENKKEKEKKSTKQRKEEVSALNGASVFDEKQTDSVSPSISTNNEEFQLPTSSSSYKKLLIRPGGHWFEKVSKEENTTTEVPTWVYKYCIFQTITHAADNLHPRVFISKRNKS